MVVVLFILASFSGKIAVYTFRISNLTGHDVKVKLFYKFFGTKGFNPYELIKKGKTRKFSFKNLNCLTQIKVQDSRGTHRVAWWEGVRGVRRVPRVYEAIGQCRSLKMRLRYSFNWGSWGYSVDKM